MTMTQWSQLRPLQKRTFFAALALLWTAKAAQGLTPDDLNIQSSWDLVEPAQFLINNTEFDYVVIGGGIGGCVVASRLVENHNYSVLLLERGAVPPKEHLVLNLSPAQSAWVTQNHYFVETLFSQPLPTTPLNQGIDATQGVGLGGGSNHNSGTWSRPLYSDLDKWNIFGWSGADMKPFFKKSENSVLAAIDPDNHGVGGPLSIEYPGGTPSIIAPILAATAQLGISIPASLSDGVNNEGLGVSEGALKQGRRQQACDAYLLNVPRTGKLHVVASALVAKLEVRRAGAANVIAGVRVLVGANLLFVRARREYILSAGVVGSPKILMLSGIGDRDHLAEVGVPVKVHLPAVGADLVARPLSIVAWSGMPGPVPEKDVAALLNPASVDEFLQNGTGAWAYPNFALHGTFRPAPGIQFIAELIRPTQGLLQTPLSTIIGVCINTLPNSRGRIKLRSSSFYHEPLFLGNLTADPTDLAALIACTRTLRQIMATPPASDIAGVEFIPGAAVQSDQELAFYIQNSNRLYSYHAYGTCRMGDAADVNAVVGPDLKLRNVRNLRVVDGSIIPGPTSGGPMALVYAIAERAAALILAVK